MGKRERTGGAGSGPAPRDASRGSGGSDGARDRSRRGAETGGRSLRQLRVGEALRHALADQFERIDFRDPALVGRRLTVTEVRVSPDLRNATAFVMPLGGDPGGDYGPVLDGLGRVAPHLRAQIARAVELRSVPALSFRVDAAFDHATRVDRLLRSPDVVRDLRPDASPPPAEPED